MSTSSIIILAAFVVYLLFMIVIGVFSMKKTNNTEDYFLGGRGLNGWVAALSAQASDMSGWLLMGLPGSIYALGTGQAWIAIGLFLGTVANWLFISKRLRRYTIVANNSLTLPEFLENRYHDKKRVLLFISSLVIVVFFLVYTASALASGGKLFSSVFGVDYHVALAIGAGVILIYTFLGGFLAVCFTDFVQGMLMLVGLLVVPIVAYGLVSSDFAPQLTATLSGTGIAYDDYLSLFSNGGKPYTFVDIISQLAWGLGYCGMPHILVRFMAVKSEKELKKIQCDRDYLGSDFTCCSMLYRCGRKSLSWGRPDPWNCRTGILRECFYRNDQQSIYTSSRCAVYRRNFPLRNPCGDHVYGRFPAARMCIFRVQGHL